jgi:23S rRNA (guanosine2251-2'-O)-methyltransferase
MENNEIIYGRNTVESLLEGNKKIINKIFLAKGIKFDAKIQRIIEIARNSGIVIQDVPREKLDSIAPGTHQGIAASVSPVEYVDFDMFLDKLRTSSKQPLVIILDGVEDPHNFGSIIRTAFAAGADGIIIPKRRSSPVTATVEKASAGAVRNIPIIQVTNINSAIEKLKEAAFWTVGADSSGDKYYFDIKYDMNCALIMGGEGKGLNQLVKKNCDYIAKIPMPGKIDSLNVANAASIMIYEIIRQRMTQ